MARVKINPVLLLSPLDPTGQSGLVRDAVLLHRLDKSTLTVCTGIANQNDIEIDDFNALSFEEVKRQLDAIGRRYWIDWAVISGIHELNMAAALVRYLEQTRPGINILWSPVLRHSDRAYGERLSQQDQALFETLCKKIHTVLLDRRDLALLAATSTPEALLSAWSQGETCFYVSGNERHKDVLYLQGQQQEQAQALTEEQQVTFLTALSSFLYEGKEINEACRLTVLFLSADLH